MHNIYRFKRFGLIFTTLFTILSFCCSPGICQEQLTEKSVEVGSDKKPDVLLLVVDTLRRDVLTCYGGKDIETPNIDRLANDGLRFENAVSPAPWTIPSMASIMTGLSPLTHGAKRTRTFPTKPPTLAKRMKYGGYQTQAIVASNTFLNPDNGNFDIGFDEYVWDPEDSVTDYAMKWYTSHSKTPSFLWLHYMEPHFSYEAPGEEKDIFKVKGALAKIRCGRLANTTRMRQKIKRAYLAEVRYVDREIGRLMNFLKGKNLYNDMIIIFVSDHGEEFWDHGGFEHGHTMYHELLGVPFIIKLSGNNVIGTHKGTVCTQDIMPTILDLCSVSYDENEIQAESLKSIWASPDTKNNNRTVISASPLYYEPRHAVTDGKWKYIRSLTSRKEELYNLEQDPGEVRNLAFRKREVLKIMREKLSQEYKKTKEFKGKADIGENLEIEFDVESQENLKALGYLD